MNQQLDLLNVHRVVNHIVFDHSSKLVGCGWLCTKTLSLYTVPESIQTVQTIQTVQLSNR